MLASLAPIIRGRCRACGVHRNIWMKELPSPHCNCVGCEGELEVVYTGQTEHTEITGIAWEELRAVCMEEAVC